MEKNRKFLFLTLSSVMGCLLVLIGIGIYLDPMQMFRRTDYGTGEQRQINFGIARNHNYETVVIGTSTSENILKKDMENILGGKSVNLALSGSSNYEQRRILKTVLENRKAKTVIYGLDVFSYNREIDEVRSEVPKYIENPRTIETLKYFVSFDNIRAIKYALISGKKPNWIEKHSYWGDGYTYSQENTLNFNPELQFGAQNLGAVRGFKNGYSLEKMKRNFDEFLKVTEKNKEVQYKIYFPPYASLWWAFADRYNSSESILEFKRYIIESVEGRKNIALYDFQKDYKIVENLDNYKDIVHYGPKISQRIVEKIKKNENRVDTKSYKEEEKIFKDKIAEWKNEYKIQLETY